MQERKKTELQNAEILSSRFIKHLKIYFVMILLREEYLLNYLQPKLVNVVHMTGKHT